MKWIAWLHWVVIHFRHTFCSPTIVCVSFRALLCLFIASTSFIFMFSQVKADTRVWKRKREFAMRIQSAKQSVAIFFKELLSVGFQYLAESLFLSFKRKDGNTREWGIGYNRAEREENKSEETGEPRLPCRRQKGEIYPSKYITVSIKIQMKLDIIRGAVTPADYLVS